MIRFIPLLVACGTPEPVAVTEAPPAGHWAGVDLERLDALGVGEPTLDLRRDQWQASAGDGWVRMVVFPTDEAAIEGFLFEAGSASSMAAPPFELAGADQAVGDGVGFVVARSHNAIVTVRRQDGGAGATATAVLGALEPAVEAPVWRERDGVSWDRYGRIVADG